MKNSLLIRIFLFFVALLSTFNAQSQVLEFEKIGLEEGLSQVSVIIITQDKFGNIWMGARNGLNRFDGKKVITYRVSENKNSIIENQIKYLHATDSIVWIGSPNALSAFNLQTERFDHYPIPSMTALHIDNNKVWVGTKSRLYVFDSKTKNYILQPLNLRENEFISRLITYENDLLVGTNMGIWRLDERDTTLLTNDVYQVMHLFVDSKQNLWVGTNRSGLIKIRGNNKLVHYKEQKGLSNNFVRCVEEDEEGKIWVGTFTGLDVINTDGSAISYAENERIAGGLSHHSIWSLYRDRDGAIWVGSYFGGVNFFNPTRQLFNYYSESNRSINFRVAGQTLEDADGNLWICTDGGGLNLFDRKKNKFFYFSHQKDRNSISGNNVKSLCRQGDSVLWIGTHRNGLNRLHLKTRKFKHYSLDVLPTDSDEAPEIRSIINYGSDFLLGTSIGLLLFDVDKGTFQHFLPPEYQNRINYLFMDEDDQVWIATEKTGLFVYNIKKRTLKSYVSDIDDPKSLPSNSVSSIYKDHMQRIWVGTLNGLSQYLPETDDFMSYYETDGLSGNTIYGIIESRYSGLIVETIKGITFFNPETKHFRNITYANGLPLRELRPNGIFNTSDGYTFVSGIEGIVGFQESNFFDLKPSTTPLVTELFINNQKVTPNSNPEIINTSVLNSPIIHLSHEHSSVTFSVSDMSFTKSDRQDLEYKLEGFDDTWIPLKGKNEITYTNLDDGAYKFSLRPIEFPSFESSLDIQMKPPFYLSNLAITFYLLLGVSLLILLNYQYIKQSKLSYSLISEKESRKKEEELNKNKIRFFTNISHEFRTPLTLIAGQVDLLLDAQNINLDHSNKLISIQKNISRLRKLIAELLDFRKLEHGQLKLKVKHDDFISLIREIYTRFEELSKHENIELSLQSKFNTYPLWFDGNQLEKVFYNILSNAFKFTPNGGKIGIEIYEEADTINVKITNTGSVIPNKSADQIFNRFYQLENINDSNQSGTGIGLALSKSIIDEHSGSITVNSSYVDETTSFTVSLRQGKDHFEADQLVQLSKVESISTNNDHIPHVVAEFNEGDETILVVEDNEEIKEFLNELISPLFNVKLACNGVEALKIIREDLPDLILSDVLMPEMDGIELCKTVKSDLLTSHIPVILLTARSSDENRIEGLETGADDYIEKPFNTRILLTRMNNMLNYRRSIQNRYNENPIQYVKKVAHKKIDKDFMEKAHEVVLKNLGNSSYNVDAFCKDMSLGRTNLFQKIKGITKQTPNDFITSIRLNKATELILNEPDFTIADIAYTCGFNNPSYFSRAFKKKYSMSPADYRMKLANKNYP